MRTLLIAIASLALAAPATAAGKAWENLGRLTSGAPVEIFLNNGHEKGEFVSSSSESLTIRTRQGERKFARPDVVRVISRTRSSRVRNLLIGAGVGAGIALVADNTLGAYLRNESNPGSARPLIWTLPIVLCGGIGAAFPGYPVIYQK